MDYLNIAKAHIDRATDIVDLVENMDPLVSTGLSIASALIALAERRPEKSCFVQVGNITIRIDDIVQINRTSTMVEVYYFGGDSATFYGKNADAFEAWWSANADVVRLDVAEEETE